MMVHCWTHNPTNPNVEAGGAHPYVEPFNHSMVWDQPRECPGYTPTKISDEDVERIAKRVAEIIKELP